VPILDRNGKTIGQPRFGLTDTYRVWDIENNALYLYFSFLDFKNLVVEKSSYCTTKPQI
jgi:hypothetical protein